MNEQLTFENNTIKHLALKIVSVIPNNISELYNDSKFITENQINDKADKVKVEQGGEGVVTKTINPNVFYEFGTCTQLTIQLSPEIPNIYNSYNFEFKSGSLATRLSVPSTIKWNKQPLIKLNKIYQVSIVNNLAIIGEF